MVFLQPSNVRKKQNIPPLFRPITQVEKNNKLESSCRKYAMDKTSPDYLGKGNFDLGDWSRLVYEGDNPENHSQGACCVDQTSKPYFSAKSFLNFAIFERILCV